MIESSAKMEQYSKFITLGVLLLTLTEQAMAASSFKFLNPLEEFEKLYVKLNPEAVKGRPGEKLLPIDWLLEDFAPLLIGQSPNNENGTKWEYKEFAWLDSSNDDAIRLSGQELITRSGFKFETFDAKADDGYVTIVTHLINPLADHTKLRQPPILMEHGGTIDPTAYLLGSSMQHHPEKWPRTQLDGPITSWNRSLAFVLANNGFDVWLAETRGANEKNERHDASRSAITIAQGANERKNMSLGESIDQLLRQWTYYSFSMDDIIAHEIKSHMDLVIKKTGVQKMHLFSFSLSTPSTLGFFSIRPDYAEKVQGYVSMAPIISGEGVNKLIKTCLQYICPLIPDNIGGIHITDIVLTQPFRELIIWLAQSRYFRYSIIKSVTTLVFGPSAKYGTNLELNLLGHMLRHLSFRFVKQMCQQTKSNKLQKYDYGPIKNKFLYNSTHPPVYDLRNLKFKDWIIVTGSNDKLATVEVTRHLISITNPKPLASIVAPGFNHLDLMGHFENDRYVNLPILQFFQLMSDRFENGDDLEAAGARSFDLKSFLPPQIQPEKLTESAQNITNSLTNITSSILNPEQFIGTIQKNLLKIFNGFGPDLLSKLTKGSSGGGGSVGVSDDDYYKEYYKN